VYKQDLTTAIGQELNMFYFIYGHLFGDGEKWRHFEEGKITFWGRLDR